MKNVPDKAIPSTSKYAIYEAIASAANPIPSDAIFGTANNVPCEAIPGTTKHVLCEAIFDTTNSLSNKTISFSSTNPLVSKAKLAYRYTLQFLRNMVHLGKI